MQGAREPWKTKPGQVEHWQEPAQLLALSYDHGAHHSYSMEWKQVKNQEGTVNFPHGHREKLKLLCATFFHLNSLSFSRFFFILVWSLIWHTAPESRGHRNMCFYDATRGSHSVLFWEPW
jgi:hypothetical protein